MQLKSFARLARAITPPVVALAMSLPWLVQAAPTLAGPSVGKVSEAAVFSGSGYVANSAVSISVTLPGGAEATFSAVVAADGSLSYSVAPTDPGVHSLKVLDSGGNTLSSAMFIARP
ncbi:MAG TPA: hypothetical protein VKI18_17795 [Albitalea sp.]|nr:hypothetical protein [Albitalea sp.]